VEIATTVHEALHSRIISWSRGGVPHIVGLVIEDISVACSHRQSHSGKMSTSENRVKQEDLLREATISSVPVET